MTDTLRKLSSPLVRLARHYGLYALVGLLAGFLTLFIYRGRSELLEALSLIASIGPAWFAVLLMLHLVVLSSAAIIYRTTLKRLGHSVGFLRLAEIQLQRLVVGTVTPLGGPPSLYVMVRSLAHHRVPAGDALLTASARSFATLAAFTLILPPALLLQRPGTATLAAASVLLLLLGGMMTMFVFLLRSSSFPQPIERRMPDRLIEALHSLRRHRIGFRDLMPALLFGIVWHLTMATMLFVALLAVGYHPAPGTVLVGYVAGNLMILLAPVFRGVGMVELAMALALQQAGVPAVEAVGAALLFRVGDLWIPLVGGSLLHATRLWLETDLVSDVRETFKHPTSSDAWRWLTQRRRGTPLRAGNQGLITVVIDESDESGESDSFQARTPDRQRAELGSMPGIPPAHPPQL